MSYAHRAHTTFHRPPLFILPLHTSMCIDSSSNWLLDLLARYIDSASQVRVRTVILCLYNYMYVNRTESKQVTWKRDELKRKTTAPTHTPSDLHGSHRHPLVHPGPGHHQTTHPSLHGPRNHHRPEVQSLRDPHDHHGLCVGVENRVSVAYSAGT